MSIRRNKVSDMYFDIVKLLHEAYKTGYNTPKGSGVPFAGDPIEMAFRTRITELLEKYEVK